MIFLKTIQFGPKFAKCSTFPFAFTHRVGIINYNFLYLLIHNDMITSFRHGGLGRDKLWAFFALELLFQPLVSAATAGESLGIHFESRNQNAPLLKLDYATYRATYNETYDVSYHSSNSTSKKLTNLQTYVFKNVRFAAPLLGQLRWAKPAPPLKADGVQEGAEGRSCTQSIWVDLLQVFRVKTVYFWM